MKQEKKEKQITIRILQQDEKKMVSTLYLADGRVELIIINDIKIFLNIIHLFLKMYYRFNVY